MDELKFKIKLFLICSVISVLAYSQNSSNGYKSGIAGILNAPNPEDIGVRTSVQIQEDEDGPLEYGFVDDNDILWSTMVWEIIDLNQKVNFPLLYPTDLDVVGDERRPMLWWLRQEIEAGRLKIYDEGVDDGNFINPVEEKDIANIFSTYKIFKEAEDEYLGENITITLRDTLDFQKESLGFNPYENPDGDERKIDAEIKGYSKISKKDIPLVTTRLKHQIISVNGETEKSKISEFIDSYLLAQDARALRNHIKERTPDVDLTFFPEGRDEKADLPIGISFFWPDI